MPRSPLTSDPEPDLSRNRGGAAVGTITDLDPIATAAVLYLRLWCDGPHGKALILQDLCLSLPPTAARDLCDRFGALCDLCLAHARRPVMRHAITCACVGADEACFAHLVAAGSEAAREDAMLFAALLMRPDIAIQIAPLVEEVGMGLRRMTATITARPPRHDLPRRDLH